MLKLGTNNIDKIYLGDTKIAKAYLGDTLVYNSVPVHDYSQDYLTFEALESGVIAFTFSYSSSIGSFNSISYSLDNGNTWVTTNNINSREVTVTTPTLSVGQKILWKGDMPIRSTQGASTASEASATFDVNGGTTGKYKIYGNPKSLFSENFLNITLNNDGFWFRFLFYVGSTNKSYIIDAKNLILPNTVLPYCYAGMFTNQSQLIAPPILPATTLASRCYGGMFSGCTSLTTAPELPATTLANDCYNSMFRACTSLTTSPALPATTLTTQCYYSMFYGCTSLTTAPVLPATTLVSGCYSYMFYGCTRLNYIKAMFLTTSQYSHTYNWVNGVASTGTFVKNSAATWNVTGNNGIPSGWTVTSI